MSLALVLAAGASRQAHAQDRASTQPSPHVSIGGFFSANVASVAVNPSPGEVVSRQWEGGGATVDVPLTRLFSIDARAMWNRKGARLPVAGTSALQDISADYLSFPALVKASMPGSVRPYLIGGAEFAVRLRAKVRTVLGPLENEEDATSLVRRTDLSLDFGAGVERILGASRVFVEGLYAYGLRNVTPDPASSDSARTRTFTLLAGLRF
jgi:Outer membrane protein beta-barrel domain